MSEQNQRLSQPSIGELAASEVAKHKFIPGYQAPHMYDLYPKYFKDVSKLQEVDVYMIHTLFNIQDPSGAIQHASKKLLLSGVRTGGKSFYDDVREARDTLNRWLEINKPTTQS